VPLIAGLLLTAGLIALAGCAGGGPGGEGGGLAGLTPAWLGGKSAEVTVLSTVKAGPYEASTLAVGEAKDIAQHRGDGLGYVRSAVLEEYLNETRGRLIAATGKTGVPGRVMILAHGGFVAFSTPDGNVYVAMGLLETLESADEVAAILAHETAHVLLKHHTSDLIGDMQKKGLTLFEMEWVPRRPRAAGARWPGATPRRSSRSSSPPRPPTSSCCRRGAAGRSARPISSRWTCSPRPPSRPPRW
jgi:hypothetical protein